MCTLTLVVGNLVALADMGTPLQTILLTRWTMDNNRYNEVRIVPLTMERLAVHNLVHGRTAWVIRSTDGGSSSLWSTYKTSSVSIETAPAETTEATRGNWVRTGLEEFCHCGRCELHWFRYGWECWE